MWFRLACLWGCTVREAQARCNSAEFAEWCAAYQLDPWGPERTDLNFAMLACVVASTVPRKSSRAFRLEDFLLKFDHQPKRQTAAQMVAFLKMHTRAFHQSRRKRGKPLPR